MIQHQNLFIDGRFCEPAENAAPTEVENPFNREIVGHIPSGGPADVDRAVAAATRALPGWAGLPAQERADYLERIADGLENRQEEIAMLITQEVGTPMRVSRSVQAGLPVKVLREAAGALRATSFETKIGNSIVQRVPIGVVGAITPWNYPLHQIVGKVAGALAAGAPIVLKPSDIAPLSAFILAEVISDAGVPAGVFNLVSGSGRRVGEALISHPGVGLVSFTGSTATGSKVAAAAALRTVPTSLELGGKSASVVLPDADLATAIKVSVANAFLNAGQTCTAWSRLLLPNDRMEEAEPLLIAAANRYAPGDPGQESTRMGPLVSSQQRDRVLELVEKGKAEGARILTGGVAHHDAGTGYFVEPTVLVDVEPQSTVAQEEIFGPVLVVIGYETVDDAIEIANGTGYGLAGGVWSADTEKAADVAGRLLAGQVDINGAAFNPAAPFGGFKQSGYGREFGIFGLEEYLTTRSIQY